MPRCWPDEPQFRPGYDAERLVWERMCAQLPDDSAVFSQVAFLDDRDEREADLIVAWPGRGIAVIEVKGGHVTVEHGQWWQGRATERHEIDPVRQVSAVRHALGRYLKARGWDRPLRLMHAVAVPYVDFPRDAVLPDLPRAALLDRLGVENIGASLEALLRDDPHGAPAPTSDDVLALEDLLEVTLPSQLDELSVARQHEAQADQLTRDQFRLLGVLGQQRRLLITGGAGTGKTHLALEQARRLAADGQRVALTCYSRGLAAFLRRATTAWRSEHRPAYVGTFHGLAVDWGAEPGDDDDGDYWENRLPAELARLAAARPTAARFDAIVLDEAQDFGESWWPALTACLRDPERGGLAVFLDRAQRVFARRGEPPALLTFDLDENVRNTKQIAQVFSSLDSERQLRFRGSRGAAVRLVECPEEQAQDRADSAVVRLLDEGWPAEDIALLTTHHRHPVHKERLDRWGHEAYWTSFFTDAEDVFYGHVLGFKGLERQVVVLAVDGFRDVGRARELLYVGLSRARALLVLVGDRERLVAVGGEGLRQRLERDVQPWPVE